MLMLDASSSKTYRQRCINLDMINEATMVYTKAYSEANKFSNNMTSEGIDFCIMRDIIETRIDDIMVCIAHQSNTVDKKPWVDKQYEESIDMTGYKSHLEIISRLTI